MPPPRFLRWAVALLFLGFMANPMVAVSQNCQDYSLCVVPVNNDPSSTTRTFKLVLEIPGGQLTNLNGVNFVLSVSNAVDIDAMNVTQLYMGPPNVPLMLGVGSSQVTLANIAAMNGAIISSPGQPLDLFQVTFEVIPGQCAEVGVGGFSQIRIPPIFPLDPDQQCFPSVCTSGPASYTACLSLLSISGFALTLPPAECYGTVNKGLDNAIVRVFKIDSGIEISSDLTDNYGLYTINNIPPTNDPLYELSAIKEDNPGCGVNSFDLSQLNGHILSTASLSNYGQLFAADMNRDDLISVLDVIYMRRLMQGEFPGEFFSSWRFKTEVDFSNYVNQTPPPFLNLLPFVEEAYSLASFTSNLQNMGFIGIKSGDIDRTCTDCSGNQRPGSEEGSGAYTDTAPVLMRIPTGTGLKAGDRFRIPLFIDEDLNLSALLLSLAYDPAVLDNITLASGQIMSIDEQPPHISNGAIRWAWAPSHQAYVYNSSSAPLVYIEGQAKRDVPAGKVLFSSLGSELVVENLQLRPCTLIGGAIAVQATPNPFRDEVQLSLDLGVSTPLTITWYNSNGQLIDQYRLQAEAGPLTWVWPQAHLAPSGVIFYRVDSSEGSLYGKLVKQ